MTADKPDILVADDQPDVLEALRLLLKGDGFDVDTVNSPAPRSPRSSGATSTRCCST